MAHNTDYISVDFEGFRHPPFPYSRVAELFTLKFTELKVILYIYHVANSDPKSLAHISNKTLSYRLGSSLRGVKEAISKLSKINKDLRLDAKQPWILKHPTIPRRPLKFSVLNGLTDKSNVDALAPQFFGVNPYLFKLIGQGTLDDEGKKIMVPAMMASMSHAEILTCITMSIVRYQRPDPTYSFTALEVAHGLNIKGLQLPSFPFCERFFKSLATDALNMLCKANIISALNAENSEEARFSPFPPAPESSLSIAPMQHSAPPEQHSAPQHSAPPKHNSAPPTQHSAPLKHDSAPPKHNSAPYTRVVEYRYIKEFITILIELDKGTFEIEDKYGEVETIEIEDVLNSMADHNSVKNKPAYLTKLRRNVQNGIVVNPSKDFLEGFEGVNITTWLSYRLAGKHDGVSAFAKGVIRALGDGMHVQVADGDSTTPVRHTEPRSSVNVLVGEGERTKEVQLEAWVNKMSAPIMTYQRPAKAAKVNGYLALLATIGDGERLATFYNVGGKGGEISGVITKYKDHLMFTSDGIANEIDNNFKLMSNYSVEGVE